MSEPEDTNGNSPQGEEPERHKPKKRPAKRYQKRRRQWENWISLLLRMPRPLFLKCVDRLRDREPANRVACWLLQQPDRGEIQHLGYHALRLYLQVLRIEVLARDGERTRRERLARRRALRNQIRREKMHQSNVISIDRALDELNNSQMQPDNNAAAAEPPAQKQEPGSAAVAEKKRPDFVAITDALRELNGTEQTHGITNLLLIRSAHFLQKESEFPFPCKEVTNAMRLVRELKSEETKSRLVDLKEKQWRGDRDGFRAENKDEIIPLTPEEEEHQKKVHSTTSQDRMIIREVLARDDEETARQQQIENAKTEPEKSDGSPEGEEEGSNQ